MTWHGSWSPKHMLRGCTDKNLSCHGESRVWFCAGCHLPKKGFSAWVDGRGDTTTNLGSNAVFQFFPDYVCFSPMAMGNPKVPLLEQL